MLTELARLACQNAPSTKATPGDLRMIRMINAVLAVLALCLAILFAINTPDLQGYGKGRHAAPAPAPSTAAAVLPFTLGNLTIATPVGLPPATPSAKASVLTPVSATTDSPWIFALFGFQFWPLYGVLVMLLRIKS